MQINKIENQVMVFLNENNTELVADLIFNEGKSQTFIKISGTTPLTPVKALSLIDIIQSSLRQALDETIET